MPVCRDSSAAVSFRSSIHALSTSGAALKLRMAALLFIEQLPDETYRITDKGREHEEITCDAIAYPVMQRALTAVQRFNNQMQRKGLIETNVRKEESGDFIAELCLRDDAGILMRLELSAPTLSQARGLTRAYEKQADSIYQQMMTLLLGGSGEKHADV